MNRRDAGGHVPDEVGLGRLLEGHDGRRLESQVGLEVLSDLTDKTLEAAIDRVVSLSKNGRERVEKREERGTHGSFRMRSSVDFWYLLISRRATVPGRYLWGFLTPPAAGADLRAALAASCFRGALPPVDLRAVCFVRAIAMRFG